MTVRKKTKKKVFNLMWKFLHAKTEQWIYSFHYLDYFYVDYCARLSKLLVSNGERNSHYDLIIMRRHASVCCLLPTSSQEYSMKNTKKNMCHIITASRVLTLRRKKISLMNFVACPFMSKRFESRFNE